MKSSLSPSAPIAAGAQDVEASPAAARVRAWLSLYGACCTEEEVSMHPAVLSRVLRALEVDQSRDQLHIGNDGTPAATTATGACRSSKVHGTTETKTSPIALCNIDSRKGSGLEAGLSLDLCGLWMPSSEWIATLRSLVTAVPLRSLSLRDTALGDVGLRCLCRQAATASLKPAPVGPACSCEGSGAHLPGLLPLSTPCSAPHPILEFCAMHALQLLDLSGAELADGGPLSSLLASCPYLHSLNLSDNRLGTHEPGLALLCAALQLHPSLEVLNLSRNSISGRRGGLAIAALAELIVARSLAATRPLVGASAPASVPFGEDISAAAVVARQPLRRLDLSHNLLGTYFLLSATTLHHGARGKRLAATLLSDMTFSAGRHVGVYEAVTSFPLVTALYLNNAIAELNLRDNGLPDALLEYVEAKLRTNHRTAGGGTGLSPTASSELIASTTVRRVLTHRLRCTLGHILAEAPNASGAIGSTCSGLESVHSTAGPTISQPSGSPAAERRWTTDEVASLVQHLVRSIALDLSFS
ncbi:hypothetical protein LSCM1_05707 [Leishmania martiniquensis]|uniref:Uncharacterized protein n=1 Tax=Leishmania martiniquensis TaxID=1580590 RepID=A0A836GXK4_9TRYP|nr:hypothetical protein LSCM1_05707 [Leishmania martiniquensis]